MSRIILASASPRRANLLRQAGFEFEVLVSDKEEKIVPADPRTTVENLSRQKAENVETKCSGDYVIIGADTVVSCDEEILGKPSSEEEAFHMLKELQGRTHQVYTGVTIIEKNSSGRRVTSFYRKTDVEMYPATDAQLKEYIAAGEYADKAGAYAIQGRAAVFVKKIDGDYNNVVGLPVSAIWQYFNGGGLE